MSHYTLLVTRTNRVSVDQQLAPFKEIDGHDRVHRRWDWYRVGGRSLGYFKLKQGAEGRLGGPGAYSNKPRFDADIAKAQDIDWMAMLERVRKRREKDWDVYQEKLAAHAQSHSPGWRDMRSDDDRESYVHRASVAPDAVLHNGTWHEDGRMGLFYEIGDPSKTERVWNLEFADILVRLDPDDEMTLVDCHI